MKPNKTKTTTLQSNTNEYTCELSSKELKEIHRKYHLMVTNKSFKVDDDYMKRFNTLLGAETK